MKTYITRKEVREINKKLFAHDIIYTGTDDSTIDEIIGGIIQRYNPEDTMCNVPTIIELKADNIDSSILDKILIMHNESVIIEVNNDIFADKNKSDIIRELKKHNYAIAVTLNKDDQVFSLVNPYASFIKFDINKIPDKLASGEAEISSDIDRIAFNVNSAEDYAIAEASGIKLYEGDYISTRKQIELETNDHSKVNFIEIISLANSPNANISDIAKVIARDTLMSAQIIRLSNSSYFGNMGKRIDSIDKAVVRIGIKNLKSWIFLIQFSSGDVDEDLLQTSYHRAVFCEKIMKNYKNKELSANDAYLIGLFSIIDIMTGKSMEDEIPKLNLSLVIEDALVYREGIGGSLLNLVKAYDEAGDIGEGIHKRFLVYGEKFTAKTYSKI